MVAIGAITAASAGSTSAGDREFMGQKIMIILIARGGDASGINLTWRSLHPLSDLSSIDFLKHKQLGNTLFFF